MASTFCVSGGRPLQGTIRPAGNKNAALPILAATLLADGPCRLDNVPRIRDVETMLALLAHLGAAVEWTGNNTLTVDPRAAAPRELDPALCARIRASILLAGPMLARFGRVQLPPPGGDVIGRRRVDTHFLALERLGAEVAVGDSYRLEASALTGADIFLDEPSVTGTENALMAAVAARGTTVLRNAASEPHVQDLARFLVACGAHIDGIGSNALTVQGGAKLSAPKEPFGAESFAPPCTVSALDPMPSMCAPQATRKRARSWTCGSEAALRSTVVPRAATAAISAFSVPVTLGSSRKMSAPVSALASNR